MTSRSTLLSTEDRVFRRGKAIIAHMRDTKSSVLSRAFWQDALLALCMRYEPFKVESFRFVDVFPALTTPEQVHQHLIEYFTQPHIPAPIRWASRQVPSRGALLRFVNNQIKKNIGDMASRFIAGRDPAQSLKTLQNLRAQGIAFTLDLLGEACLSETEADAYLTRYLALIDDISARAAAWPADPRVDGDRFARVNISIKPSALDSQIDPIAPPDSAAAGLRDRLRVILRAAAARGVCVNLDIERAADREVMHGALLSLLEEPEFATLPEVGCVVQAYLCDSHKHLDALLTWAKRTGRRISIRLVKGAYWDYEVVHAQQMGWPIPVFTHKAETDAQFERLTASLMASAAWVTPAIASHNVRSLAWALECAQQNGLGRNEFEFQALYGMAAPLKAALVSLGWRVRDYVPVGEVVPGMAYLVRRLLENTSNESWLRRRSVEKENIKTLLQSPADALAAAHKKGHKPAIADTTQGAPHGPGFPAPFQNEPLRDYAAPGVRDAMVAALARVRAQWLGKDHGCVINNKTLTTGAWIERHNPSQTAELIGRVAAGRIQDAEEAIAAAVRAWPAWRDLPVQARATLLRAAADLMRAERDELSALIVLEVGKDWRGADGDVCEAIDFLEYYAHEMCRLAHPQRLGHYPGELNHLSYQPKGVCAVIAPWNFPLAILTGMTAAALVTGNTVVMKPAEQSGVIGAHLMRILMQAGFPAGVVNLLSGEGEVVGAHLTIHPKIDVIAFTGSQAVGLKLLEAAGRTPPEQRTLKRVVCELGGKNAIIIDDDADIDEAIEGVLQSAFDYQGQKCSACSRVVVLQSIYKAFCDRLALAVQSLHFGPSDDPRTDLGPVVDAEALARITEYAALAATEGRIIAQVSPPPELSAHGHYAPLLVVADVSPDARIAQEEIFGPLLCLMPAATFDDALTIALNSPYALTGGVYSRSPAHIDQARTRFRVGNLYINRSCTGALVWRQPFGGGARSGVGSKAGGPDYLLQWMDPRVITENTMRRGFAPIT